MKEVDEEGGVPQRDAKWFAIQGVALWLGAWGSLLTLSGFSDLLSETSLFSICQMSTGFGALATASALGRRMHIAALLALITNLVWVTVVAVGARAFPDGWMWWGVMFAMPLVPGLAIWLPALRRRLKPLSAVGDRRERWRWLTSAVLAFLGIGVVVVVVSEASRAQASFREYRLREECEATRDIEACASAARLQLEWADSIEEAEAAARQFHRICKEDRNGSACLWWAHTRSAGLQEQLSDGGDLMGAHRARGLRRLCEEGNGSACWAAFALDLEAAEDLVEFEPAIEADCEAGDALACDLLTRPPFAGAETASGDAHRARACALGWARHCEASVLDARRLCWAGDHGRCAEAATSASDALEASVYRAMVQETFDEETDGPADVNAFIGRVPAGDRGELRAACERSEAWGCLGAGLWLVEQERKDWRPALPDAEQLDATFGRGCELGMDASCIAYAVRLLDTPAPTVAALERANELANVACERGNHRACWLREYGGSVEREEYVALRDSAREACFLAPADSSHPGCRTYANLLAVDLGASSSPMDDRVYFHLIRGICSEHRDRWACTRVTGAILNDRSVGLGLRRVAYDSAALACSAGSSYGCRHLTRVPEVFGDGSPSTAEELRASVCEKAGVCEW